jgi:hypothetical protein
VAKTFNAHVQSLLFFLILPLLLGCTAGKKPEPTAKMPPPEITTAYLLEHRIISYAPKFQEKIVTTLPYEIRRFEESYLLYLVARIPDTNGASVFKAAQPVYYLWLERISDNWRDFSAVRSTIEAPLEIYSHYSAIRHGEFYEEYTINFTPEQLAGVQDSGLDLLLINQHNQRSNINIPAHYIKAFLEMLQEKPEPSMP